MIANLVTPPPHLCHYESHKPAAVVRSEPIHISLSSLTVPTKTLLSSFMCDVHRSWHRKAGCEPDLRSTTNAKILVYHEVRVLVKFKNPPNSHKTSTRIHVRVHKQNFEKQNTSCVTGKTPTSRSVTTSTTRCVTRTDAMKPKQTS